MEDGMKIVSDRWMLQSRQIVNWGSYGGYHVFRPSMDDAMPVTLLAAGVSTAAGIRDQDSEISTEIAVIDATDQQVVAQVVRKGTGLTLENDSQVMTLDDFKWVLDGWALDMRREYLSSRH